MKLFLTIAMLFAGLLAKGQEFQKEKEWIDSVVAKIDTMQDPLHPGFLSKQPKPMVYRYKTLNNRIIMITRLFSEKTDSVVQDFYLHHDRLIYAIEIIRTFNTSENKTEALDWGGRYYFSGRRLIDYRTMGHGKSEEDNWDPQKEVLRNYDAALKEVKKIYKGAKPN